MAFFKPLGTVSGRTNSDLFLDAIGGSGGKYVSVKYLKNSDIFTAAKVVAQDIATNPIQLLENDENIIDDDLNYLLNVRPNEAMTARSFKFALAVNLLLAGNAYAQIIKTTRGKVIELRLLSPSWVQIYQHRDQSLYYEITDDDGNNFVLENDEILHYKYFTTDGLLGMSPLYALETEVAIQDSGNGLLKDFFKSGVNGSGILTVHKSDLSPQAKRAIREKFVESAASSSRIIVTDDTTEYKNLEVDTSILKLVNSNNYSTRQIAKAFSIPTFKLGIEGSHTSIQQANLDYIQNSLDHYFDVFNSENNIKLLKRSELRTKHFDFDISRLLKMDTAAHIEKTIDEWKNGAISYDEYRRELGHKPVGGELGDTRVVMSNYVPLDKVQWLVKSPEDEELLAQIKAKYETVKGGDNDSNDDGNSESNEPTDDGKDGNGANEDQGDGGSV